MKQPKAPTKAQKIWMSKHGLVWTNWQVRKEDSSGLAIIHKHTGTQRIIPKVV